MTIKLACFDIDDTIINGHLHRALESAGVPKGEADPETIRTAVRAVGGIKNQQALKSTMKKLLGSGVNIAVTSYTGYPETIPVVLEMVGLSPAEIARVQVASFTPPKIDGKPVNAHFGKNQHIEQAIESFGGNIPPNEVVLIDDRIDHYELAKRKGYNVIWVQGSEGDVGYLNELREMAGLSKAVVIPPRVVEAADLPKPGFVDRVLSWFGLQRMPSPQGMER